MSGRQPVSCYKLYMYVCKIDTKIWVADPPTMNKDFNKGDLPP